MLAIMAAGALGAAPAWADRGGGRGHGQGYFWGPFGFLLGSAIVYSAMQPRTVYYGPPVTYLPYGPVTTVGQAYYVDPIYVSPPVASIPPPPQGSSQISALGLPGSEWWYFCKDPNGYYPYVRECQSGWEKVSPTPPGVIKP
ncbi:MAG: hypothetical protein D4S02_03230 [Rhodocyclaceae bacterium]|nr:MAG: hypothetical protein D4S02_03230 [Rhodocyclaceae bacterium]